MKYLLLCLFLCIPKPVDADIVNISGYINSGRQWTNSDSLRAANAYSDTVWAVGGVDIAVDFVVADIDTNIVVRLEASNDMATWTNTGIDRTITADGMYSILFDKNTVYRYFRLLWVSQQGSGAIIAPPKFRVGR